VCAQVNLIRHMIINGFEVTFITIRTRDMKLWVIVIPWSRLFGRGCARLSRADHA